jgi:hypothetical protein
VAYGIVKFVVDLNGGARLTPELEGVIELDGERFWIKWNLKHVDMIPPAALASAVADDVLDVVARLRESHALKLQQKMLSGMGRIGLSGLMLAAALVRVQVCFPGPDQVPVPLPVDALQTESTCFVGRPGVRAMRLVLTDEACEQIAQEVAGLDVNLVHERAADALRYLQTNSGEMTAALNKGLELPSPHASQLKGIPPSSGVMSGNRTKSIGVIARNRRDGQALGTGDLVNAGVIVLVTDSPHRAAALPAAPERGGQPVT